MHNISSLQWVPLESDPELYNKWAVRSGLASSEFRFQDIYGLDPDLLAIVPQPVKAVVFIYPEIDTIRKRDQREAAKGAAEELTPVHPSAFYVPQTIENACGAMAIIHCLANSGLPLVPGSPLSDFFKESQDKTPDERAKILEGSQRLAEIHHELAIAGQSAVTLTPEGHYTAFVQLPSIDGSGASRLVELNGAKLGPMDRGPCEDLLHDVARHIKEEFIQPSGRSEFNLIALCQVGNEN